MDALKIEVSGWVRYGSLIQYYGMCYTYKEEKFSPEKKNEGKKTQYIYLHKYRI